MAKALSLLAFGSFRVVFHSMSERVCIRLKLKCQSSSKVEILQKKAFCRNRRSYFLTCRIERCEGRFNQTAVSFDITFSPKCQSNVYRCVPNDWIIRSLMNNKLNCVWIYLINRFTAERTQQFRVLNLLRHKLENTHGVPSYEMSTGFIAWEIGF